jgi:ABC-type antimicrobial peptide transport system permease subunit
LISLAGAVLGTLGAIGLTKIISIVPNFSGLIMSHISPGVVAQGFAIATIMGVLGAAYPAYWGACLAPTIALRQE